MTDIATLRETYRAQKTTLLATLGERAASTRTVRNALQRMSNLVDSMLVQLWELSGMQATYALLAVGGFGRAELFPSSDVDVLVLLPDGTSPEHDTDLKGRIEAFISNCWDLGLEIGSSVRSVSECLEEAERDVTIQTALLESRRITGSAQLAQTFQKAFFADMDPKAFFVAKTLELRQRLSLIHI